ncbi:c-type cytochrome domain-containing protein [Verrucomicrobium spinosum]|uniref:c-type cytochrome domain-containing protein n=1 Tax=Verrucomicrobium spinosum TaxID=2736 RepID=UPI00094645EC|nr:c-type cytochrome domain-containing protein [Verrucomicrobium spinosum]
MHCTRWRFLLSTALLVLVGNTAATALFAEAPVDFATQIQPLLQQHCLDCHGPEKQRGGLRLDGRDKALRGGDEHGAAILPGNGQESPLYHLASGKDPDLKMPPKGPALSATELALLKSWIDAGACGLPMTRRPLTLRRLTGPTSPSSFGSTLAEARIAHHPRSVHRHPVGATSTPTRS